MQDNVETCEDGVVQGWSIYLLIYEERSSVSCSVYSKYRVAVLASVLLLGFMIFHLA